MALSQLDLDEETESCLDTCLTAAQACEWCADECAGSEEMAKCLRLCRDAADLLTLHARFLARDSNYSAILTEACVGVCEECTEVCERHDAEHCQVCAEVLRECAANCRQMIA